MYLQIQQNSLKNGYDENKAYDENNTLAFGIRLALQHTVNPVVRGHFQHFRRFHHWHVVHSFYFSVLRLFLCICLSYCSFATFSSIAFIHSVPFARARADPNRHSGNPGKPSVEILDVLFNSCTSRTLFHERCISHLCLQFCGWIKFY